MDWDVFHTCLTFTLIWLFISFLQKSSLAILFKPINCHTTNLLTVIFVSSVTIIDFCFLLFDHFYQFEQF